MRTLLRCSFVALLVTVAVLAGCGGSTVDTGGPAGPGTSGGSGGGTGGGSGGGTGGGSGDGTGGGSGGATGDGTGGGTSGGAPLGWRPFSADSPWNTPIPANPLLDPNSAALVADLASSSPWGPHLDVNVEDWSVPVYWADASTPTFQVLAHVGGDGWTGTDGMEATGTMPIPPGATPDPAGDAHMAVVDRARGLEWGCWDMRLEGGRWVAGLCATADLSGAGVRPPATSARPWTAAHGARACGYPLLAGLIRVDEIEAGRIDHALVIAYPHIRSGWFTPPASTGSARGSANGIPCGGRIQLDPALDLDALGLSRTGKIIARALQTYGAYVGDYSGAIDLFAENGPTALARWRDGVLSTYELKDRIDLSRLRVLQAERLYDNGNGG